MNRVEIVRKLIDERFSGNQSAFARAIGKTPTHIYQWLNGIRNIGDGTARQIELALNLPEKYMWGECADIEKIDIKKQEEQPQIMCDMFSGSDNLEIDDKYITFTALGYSDIKEIKALKYWAREKLGGNLSTIRVLTMNSDSMSGTI